MKFVKHFCRIITDHELSDDDVVEYFDIVQSVVPNKLVTAYRGDDKVSVDVMAYTGSTDHQDVYEIILDEQIDIEEGERISDELDEVFEFDFEFEISLEI